MSHREQARLAFLMERGWAGARIEPLAGDASFRRYYRLIEPHRRAMLMDAPPPREDIRPFLRIAGLLRGLGYSAPETLARDIDQGFLLLEDLGDDTYTRLIARGHDESTLYALAADLLIDLHDRFTSNEGVPSYSDEKLLDEAALLIDWFLPEALGVPTAAALRAEYLDLWREALPHARAVPETLVLRDYHIDNLMLLPDRPGIGACGLLDFQDAVIGPIAYDLVSLTEDARRCVSPEVVAMVRRRYLAARPSVDAAPLDLALAVLGAQRHAKVIGIFCRLMRRDGKPAYLGHLPRLWRLIERDLARPELTPLRRWFDRIVPASARGIPPVLAAAALDRGAA